MLYLAGVDQAWNKGCAQTTSESLFLHVMKHNENVNMVGMAKLNMFDPKILRGCIDQDCRGSNCIHKA